MTESDSDDPRSGRPALVKPLRRAAGRRWARRPAASAGEGRFHSLRVANPSRLVCRRIQVPRTNYRPVGVGVAVIQFPCTNYSVLQT
jgi:hypothetical protein